MPTRRDRVRGYYAAFDEWARLDTQEGKLELERTLAWLDEQLPANARVLDLGGGPGRYTAELARRGHRVVLADVSPEQLEVARTKLAAPDVRHNVESIDEVHAEDLSRYADESFDAVLALGPFYHLVSREERERAAGEMQRVLRRDGLAFVAFIARVAGLLGLLDRVCNSPEQVPADVLREAAVRGVFRNAAEDGFQEGYYPWPGELEELLAVAGFEVLDSFSLKSLAQGRGADLAGLEPETRREVERIVSDFCRRPEVVSTSGHVLLTARRIDAN